VFGTFWLMLNEAVNRGLIKTNPAAAVKKLKNDRKAIEIITPVEVRLLFPPQWERVWGDDREAEFQSIIGQEKPAIAFIEDYFFGGRMIGRLERIQK
jgi:hypothetical protein